MPMKMTYEKALTDLEEIVNKLEQKSITIDELPQTVKKAKELVELCKKKLDQTEQEINQIIDLDNPQDDPRLDDDSDLLA